VSCDNGPNSNDVINRSSINGIELTLNEMPTVKQSGSNGEKYLFLSMPIDPIVCVGSIVTASEELIIQHSEIVWKKIDMSEVYSRLVSQ
jgi:hypothetical protein